jgi:hypothetical protein
MALRITVDVFSGRPNPVLLLEGEEEKQALARLRPAKKITKESLPPVPATILGYRGLWVEQTEQQEKNLPRAFRVANGDLLASGAALRVGDSGFEDFICGSSGPLRRLQLSAPVMKLLARGPTMLAAARSAWVAKIRKWPSTLACRCAPLYEPTWWNDGGQRQFNNNCYNYACNYRTDTFAQPGQASGAIYTGLTCAEVRPAALRDDLEDAPRANNKCPKEGHLVALVIAPQIDFHWYRKGRNGLWTHKPGGTAVTNLDNSGHTISDPRNADRGMYTDFCSFLVVHHGHIKIN